MSKEEFFWYIAGCASLPILFVFINLSLWFWLWIKTQQRILKARKEWHSQNPYWKEAFSSGLQHVLPDLKTTLTSANPYEAIRSLIDRVEGLIKHYKAEGRKENGDGSKSSN